MTIMRRGLHQGACSTFRQVTPAAARSGGTPQAIPDRQVPVYGHVRYGSRSLVSAQRAED